MEKNYLASTKRIIQKNLNQKIRFFSPTLRLNQDSDLPSNKRKSNVQKDLNFDRSLQFSPIRYVNSPDSKLISKKVKKPTAGLASVLKTARSHLSPSKMRKNLSHKVLNPASPASASKVLSPKQLINKKSLGFGRNKLEDSKIWKKIFNVSNGIEPSPAYFTNYLVFVGRGNNSSLVKKTLLARNWWSLTEDKDKANFVWTQWKDKAFLATLPSGGEKVYERNEGFFNGLAKDLPAGLKLITESKSFCALKQEKFSPEATKMHNKLEFNNHISNKKSLFLTMKDFYTTSQVDVFSKVPLTFNISQKFEDPEFHHFRLKHQEFETYRESHPSFQNIWIVKPGEFTNRGTGISVCKTIDEVSKLIDSSDHPLIVQKYIESPLLISKRKFDIRCYSLITCINGIMQGYFYLDGYLRTASSEFNIKDCSNLYVHLTNDAIQKNSKEYGKYENGNKLSYAEFQRYLDRRFPDKKPNFISEILPGIKNIVKETILASWNKLDSNKRGNCMEIFGYDFMIDRSLKPWLIEVNTNPCLELSSIYLAKLIPAMLDNAFRIAIDTVFQPPLGEMVDVHCENRFELIFHEVVDGIR